LPVNSSVFSLWETQKKEKSGQDKWSNIKKGGKLMREKGEFKGKKYIPIIVKKGCAQFREKNYFDS